MSHHRRVYVVARDGDLRRLLAHQVSALGTEPWPFPGGSEFLRIVEHLEPGCILLDMDLVDLPGLDLLDELAERGIKWPVIALSGRESLVLAVETMKRRALDFLGLPVGSEQIARALAPAWQLLEEAVEETEAKNLALERLGRLTSREIDVALALLNGGSNKRIAHDFGISVRTVEMHRAHIMSKLGVRSLAEVALLATRAGLNLNRRDQLASITLRSEGPDCRAQLSALARRLAATS
jgi:two-component system response regulator FixJ